MKRSLLTCLLIYFMCATYCQTEQLSYGQYKEYSLGGYRNDLSYWMYNMQMEEQGIPSDPGYYVGFKICEAYYAKQSDKRKAVKDILERTDFENILRESGYGDMK